MIEVHVVESSRGPARRLLSSGAIGALCGLAAGLAGCSSQPDSGPFCGNDVREAEEVCDGAELGPATCASAVAPGWVGTLACTAGCTLDDRACTPPETTYRPLSEGWSTFDVSALGAQARGFRGAAFDGRHLYLVPNSDGELRGTVARYDTEAAFEAAASWTLFDVTTVDPDAVGFQGAAFDGRHLYLIPSDHGLGHGTLAQYDTRAGFGDAAAWTTFDVASLDESLWGFAGAAFDGRYLYLVPRRNTASHGRVARYDTQAPLDAAASWTSFDVRSVDDAARGFLGAAFDGRYLYLVPYHDGSAYHGTVARLDTHAAFDSAAAWRTFDVAAVDAGARGFVGAAFDGRHLYLVPLRRSEWHGTIARHDTQGDFGAAASWSTFDVTTVDPDARGFQGATFDGRHLYLVPFFNGTAYHGIVPRYDTEAAFAAPASWTRFDVSTVEAGARGFFGAAFDGRHVYLVPSSTGAPHGTVARFEAKSPAWLPRGWHASFL
jgi:hypothetical protein